MARPRSDCADSAPDPRAVLTLLAISGEQRQALRESIAAQGVLVPIVVSAGPAFRGEIADGQLRHQLAAELGCDCPQEQRRFGDEYEFVRYRLTINLKRRQLSVPERIRLGLQLEPLERTQAAARKAQAAGKPRGAKALPVALPEEKGETAARVARLVGLKPSTYARGARVIQDGPPELVAALDQERETVNSAWRKLRRYEQRDQVRALARELADQPLPPPGGRYPVVVADFPWPYSEGTLPYPTMTIEQIAAFPLPDLLTADAIVWVWTTNRFLHDALQIATGRWQLELASVLTWAKDRPGTGAWLRGQTEHCLLLRRGNPIWTPGNYSTLLAGPTREHSRKPENFYALVEAACPGPKLELFAREHRPGWQAWGAETSHFPTSPPRPPDEHPAP